MERVLCLESVLARVECDEAAAAAHPRRLVAQHVQLVHGTELLHARLIKGTLRTKQNSGNDLRRTIKGIVMTELLHQNLRRMEWTPRTCVLKRDPLPPQASVPSPPPLGSWRGEPQSLCGEGVGGPNSDEGTDILVL